MQTESKMSTDIVITIPEDINDDKVIEDTLDEIVTFVEDNNTVVNILDEYDDEDRTCVICLENLPADTSMFGCRHEIHIECAIPYVMGKFQKNEDITCPTCRFVQCSAITPNYRTWRLQFGITHPPPRYITVGIDDNDTERQLRNAVVPQRSVKYYIGMTCAVLFLVTLSSSLLLLIILSALYRSNQTSG